MQVPASKKLRLNFSFVDASGNAAKVDGTPEVTASNGAVVTVTGSPDANSSDFSALVDPAGLIGPFSVSGLADVDLGEGKKELTFSLGDHEAMASPEATAVKLGDATVE